MKRGTGIRIDELKDINTLKYGPLSLLIRYDALKNLTILQTLGLTFEGGADDILRVLESPIVEWGCLQSFYMESKNGCKDLKSLFDFFCSFYYYY